MNAKHQTIGMASRANAWSIVTINNNLNIVIAFIFALFGSFAHAGDAVVKINTGRDSKEVRRFERPAPPVVVERPVYRETCAPAPRRYVQNSDCNTGSRRSGNFELGFGLGFNIKLWGSGARNRSGCTDCGQAGLCGTHHQRFISDGVCGQGQQVLVQSGCGSGGRSQATAVRYQDGVDRTTVREDWDDHVHIEVNQSGIDCDGIAAAALAATRDLPSGQRRAAIERYVRGQLPGLSPRITYNREVTSVTRTVKHVSYTKGADGFTNINVPDGLDGGGQVDGDGFVDLGVEDDQCSNGANASFRRFHGNTRGGNAAIVTSYSGNRAILVGDTTYQRGLANQGGVYIQDPSVVRRSLDRDQYQYRR
ncbi:MAG: hypothetical protein RL094_57 [Candidatus Parcubacteria bacterium]|jgi:hypothetical protein